MAEPPLPTEPPDHLDLVQALSQTAHAWLETEQVCAILRDPAQFGLPVQTVAALTPASSSLLVIDSAACRGWRRDGHSWRKKKSNPKEVREDHMRLKVDGVAVLTCGYARGEADPGLCRRSYKVKFTGLTQTPNAS